MNRDELILKNKPLVVYIAKGYRGCGIYIEDLISVGMLGLIKAVDEYREKKGGKFSHFATQIIRQTIVKEIAGKGSCFSFGEKMNQVRCACYKYLKRKEYPTYEQLMEIAEKAGTSFKTVLLAYNTFSGMCYMDHPILDVEDVGDLIMGDKIADPEVVSPEYEVGQRELMEHICKEIIKLRPIEKKIVMGLYGICGSPCLSREEMSEKLGKTKNKVDYIRVKTLRRLKFLCKKYSKD